MTLKSPFQITSRLLPGLMVAGAMIQLEYGKRPGREGRIRYQWTIDLPDGKTCTNDDLQSGCGGGSLLEGFQSLLSFLEAAGESYRYNGLEGENADLFPLPTVQWAADNQGEIGMLRCELEEAGEALIEE